MSSRIPPLLEPYLALPAEAALLLVTSVLGASSNWLVLRCLCSYLKTSGMRGESAVSEDGTAAASDVGVVLVSFLRDGAFWRDGASRLSGRRKQADLLLREKGLDLDGLARSGRFVYVDGLTGLFPTQGGARTTTATTTGRTLTSSKVGNVAAVMEAALGDLRTGKKMLIVDQLDLLLAATGDEVTSLGLQNMLLSLRERAHATLLTLAADDPLVHGQATTLEREHAALALSLAHEADAVLSLRMLDTGTARDVSGVVRVTTGRHGGGEPGREREKEKDKEFLYFVAGDGAVKVFERGT